MMSSILASSAVSAVAASSNARGTAAMSNGATVMGGVGNAGNNGGSSSSPRRLGNNGSGGGEGAANTKELMRLLDTLKTLGDANAQLLREAEDARDARREAKAAKEAMVKFRSEYDMRFAKVKESLMHYAERYGDGKAGNPVTSSNYTKSSSTKEIKKRDEIIKKLAADLRKEREETKKKDAALRKYEGFYREVKARSAEKLRQRELQEQQKKKGAVQENVKVRRAPTK